MNSDRGLYTATIIAMDRGSNLASTIGRKTGVYIANIIDMDRGIFLQYYRHG
jgi:hypothetical protein